MSFYPTKYKEFAWIKEKKYTVRDITNICDFFNFSIKRQKKSVMIDECYLYLRQGYFSSRIQRCWKKRWLAEFRKTQGPACFKRNICNNSDDFLTTETMSEIDYYFFISIEENGFIYGFNVISVYNLLKKNTPFNPYTRSPFTKEFIKTIHRRMRLNYLLKKTDHPIYHEIQIPSYDSKITDLFQKMDSLGNYTQVEWFMKLEPFQLRKFILELYDIWDYRAQLSSSTKMRICPPFGKPFLRVPIHTIDNNMLNDLSLLRMYCYSIMDELLNKAELSEHQCLGSYYILSALTLVNKEVAEAMPWLYQSVI
jgi:hypothetical protein